MCSVCPIIHCIADCHADNKSENNGKTVNKNYNKDNNNSKYNNNSKDNNNNNNNNNNNENKKKQETMFQHWDGGGEGQEEEEGEDEKNKNVSRLDKISSENESGPKVYSPHLHRRRKNFFHGWTSLSSSVPNKSQTDVAGTSPKTTKSHFSSFMLVSHKNVLLTL
jgi:hypothetical protein